MTFQSRLAHCAAASAGEQGTCLPSSGGPVAAEVRPVASAAASCRRTSLPVSGDVLKVLPHLLIRAGSSSNARAGRARSEFGELRLIAAFRTHSLAADERIDAGIIDRPWRDNAQRGSGSQTPDEQFTEPRYERQGFEIRHVDPPHRVC